MNKKKFLSALNSALADLSRQDRKKTLDFYRELIDDRLEDGLTEEDVFAQIGTPEAIAEQVLSELPPKPRRKLSAGVIVLLILGFPLWLPLVLAAAVVLLSVLIVLFAAELSFAVGGVAGVLGGLVLLLMGKFWAAWALLGPGLVCLGLAIPLFFLCIWAAKGLWRMTKNTCRSIFRRR